MNLLPQPPKPEDEISATKMGELIRAIRALTPIQGPGILLSRGPNGTRISVPQPKRGKTAAAAYPWKVEWAGAENDGEGSFVIYLPKPGSYIDPTDVTQDAVDDAIDDLEDCQERSSPWKLLDVSDSATVYLVIHRNTESDPPTYTADIINEEGSGENDMSVPIATITITTTESGTTRTIEQFVYGEMTLNTGTSAVSSTVPKPWEIRWDKAENDYIIYLPQQSFVDTEGRTNSAVTGAINSKVSVAGKPGWKHLYSSGTGTEYLIITKHTDTDAGGRTEYDAWITDNTNHGEEGDEKIVITIGSWATTAQGEHNITQYLYGAVVCSPFSEGIEWDATNVATDGPSIVCEEQYDTANKRLQVKRRHVEYETLNGKKYLRRIGTLETDWHTITGGQCVEQIHEEAAE